MSEASNRNPKRQRQKEGAQARRAAELAALRRQQRNRRFVRVGLLAGVAVAAVLLISFLGGDDDDEPVATDETSTTTIAEETTTSTTAVPIPATPLTCDAPSGENTDMATKPTVAVPDEPAAELTCQDLVVGTGDEVLNSNDVVQVHYVGVAQSDGLEFDASWGGEPATFPLDGVIAGWTQGIPGMKVGGRRVLTIPAELAYGEDGEPGGTLVFIVDLLAVNPDA
jgi:peptidylprolyl isomerase